MLILAFSTSTDRGSVALARDGKILASTHWTRTTHGSEILNLKIKQLLAKGKIKPTHLDALAVDRGPGSFTGCRIAANVAKTMAFTLDIPLFSTTSLDAMATAAAPLHRGRILAVLNAHKSLFFARWFESDGKKIIKTKGPIEAVPAEGLESHWDSRTLVVGEEFPDRLKPDKSIFNFPQAKTIAQMAAETGPQNFQDWHGMEPLYIRAPDAVERYEKLRHSP